MQNKHAVELKKAMRGMVWDEFKDCMRHGVIVLSIDEMTNVFTNLLTEFIVFQKRKEKHGEE